MISTVLNMRDKTTAKTRLMADCPLSLKFHNIDSPRKADIGVFQGGGRSARVSAWARCNKPLGKEEIMVTRRGISRKGCGAGEKVSLMVDGIKRVKRRDFFDSVFPLDAFAGKPPTGVGRRNNRGWVN